MLLSEAIEALTVACIADGRSPGTVREYRQKLTALLVFLEDRDVTAVTVHDLRRFVAHLRSQSSRFADHPHRPEVPGGLSAATVAGYVRSVRRLYGFLVTEGVITSNPARGLAMPKLPKGRAPKAISVADFLLLLAAAEGDDLEAVRDQAMLKFLAETGCRVGGLIGLRLQDVDLVNGTAYVVEKGDKRRPVFFTEFAGDALAAWLAVRPGGDCDQVFVTLRPAGHPLRREAVHRMLTRLKAESGAVGPCNPHAFRHGFARTYLLSGGDLATLSQLMGHSDIATTANSYAVFLPGELQAKHRQHSVAAVLRKEGKL